MALLHVPVVPDTAVGLESLEVMLSSECWRLVTKGGSLLGYVPVELFMHEVPVGDAIQQHRILKPAPDMGHI